MMEVGILLVLLGANAFLALAELSVVSSNKARLAAMAENGVHGARSALSLSERQDDFLSAVQVGITLVGILSGVYGGATLATPLGEWLAPTPVIGAYSYSIAYGTIVVVLTYLSVIVGELVPKQLALASPERFACLVAPVMKWLVYAAAPVVWILSTSSAVILMVMGRRPNQSPVITEEDVTFMMTEASRSGAIEEGEQDIAERALRLADRPATSIMTPRTEVTWIRLDEPLQDLTDKVLSSGHSHFPVCRKSADDVVGVLVHKEAVRHIVLTGFSTDAAQRQEQLESLLHVPVLVPGMSAVAEVVEVMKKEKTHFAIVTDEYGGMVGVLSNHDILEALVGYVAGAKHEEDAIVAREDGSYLVSGWVPMDEVFRELDVRGDARFGMMRVDSFLFSSLGRIPATGEVTNAFGLRFEVVDKDGPRVDRVLISHIQPEAAEPGQGA